jgi:hypothetical protein
LMRMLMGAGDVLFVDCCAAFQPFGTRADTHQAR